MTVLLAGLLIGPLASRFVVTATTHLSFIPSRISGEMFASLFSIATSFWLSPDINRVCRNFWHTWLRSQRFYRLSCVCDSREWMKKVENCEALMTRSDWTPSMLWQSPLGIHFDCKLTSTNDILSLRHWWIITWILIARKTFTAIC